MNILDEMQQSHVNGLSIYYFDETREWIRNYGILKQGETKPVDKNTIFHACSISKMITAITTLNLIAEGILSLEQDINTYLKGWKLSYEDSEHIVPVTLSMLLSHHAGIIDLPGSFEPYMENETPITNLQLLKGETRFHSIPVHVSQIPGSQCEYSDAGYCVIRQIIEDVTGKTVDYYADKYIFSPLSLTKTFFWHKGNEQNYPLDFCAVGHDSTGAVVKQIRACYPDPEGAGLWTTTTELACILRDLIACFYGRGRILPQREAKIMMKPYYIGAFSGLGVFTPTNTPYFFSQGWGIGMQCKLHGYLQEKRGIVVMMNCEPGVDQDHSIIGKILNGMI